MGLIFYIIPYFLFFDKEKQTLTYLKKYFIISTNNARLAQLVRASRLHREGSKFLFEILTGRSETICVLTQRSRE